MKRLPRATPEGAAARLLTLGILMTVCVQATINIAVVTGVAPTKGIALPLLSAGGTGWILTASCLGLLIALDRRVAYDTTEPMSFNADDSAAVGLTAEGAATRSPNEDRPGRAAAHHEDAPLITIRRIEHERRKAAS
jgi:hypothetical protein